MEYIKFRNVYWRYYNQLEKDVFETESYCAIDKINDKTYSVKYLQLYLSICSEFDVICKKLCKFFDDAIDIDTCGIDDYKDVLNKHLTKLTEEEVKLVGYDYRTITPLKSFCGEHHPSWWSDYNKIKHHRDETRNGKENFKYATQKNVIDSLCALFIITQYWSALNFAKSTDEKMNSKMMSFKSERLYLNKWNTWFGFMGNEWFDTEVFNNYLTK